MPERGIAHGSDVQIERCLLGSAILYRHDKPVLSDGETYPGCCHFGAQQFCETVVAASAQNRILCTKRAMCDFERGAGVVVETTHESRPDGISDFPIIEELPNAPEMLPVFLRQEFEDRGQPFDNRLVCRDLAIENAKRVRHCAAPAIFTHLRDDGIELSSESFVVSASRTLCAHRVDEQFEPGEVQIREQ